MKSKKYKDATELFKAISDGIRLDIVLFLATGEKCVCQIYKRLKQPQNLISHHLGILRECELIKNRKEGKWVFYSLNRKNIKKLQEILEEIISTKEKAPQC